MIFEGGPGGGADLRRGNPDHARPDCGGPLIISNKQRVGEQKSESKVLSPVTPNAQSAVAYIDVIYLNLCV